MIDFYIGLLHHVLINNMDNLQLDYFAIIYDNNIFIHLDIFGCSDYFYSSIVKSYFIPCSDSK